MRSGHNHLRCGYFLIRRYEKGSKMHFWLMYMNRLKAILPINRVNLNRSEMMLTSWNSLQSTSGMKVKKVFKAKVRRATIISGKLV